MTAKAAPATALEFSNIGIGEVMKRKITRPTAATTHRVGTGRYDGAGEGAGCGSGHGRGDGDGDGTGNGNGNGGTEGC